MPFICLPQSTQTTLQPVPVQVWLQEWSWTESNKAKDLDRRNAGDGSALMDLSRLRQEPMFCYETCVKLLYWTALVYDHRLDGVYSLAMSLSVCHHISYRAVSARHPCWASSCQGDATHLHADLAS